ncbi:MAG: hypothetical protein JWL72_1276 [Ilumatobacteraceae bacterium]|nr:hypothetical protein [Ilumatobacteraceae bacterium]
MLAADLDPRVLAAVDDVFATFQTRDKAPGVVYAVVAGGVPLHVGAAGAASPGGGPMHADSVLRIASMTKSFTAAAALLLRDDGLLRLDEPIGTYVPELAGVRLPTTDSPLPTIRMLLTMSGGLPSDDPWADRQESMTPDDFSALLTGGVTFSASPGTGFEYSNLGYVIVGRAITNIAGRPYRDVVRDRLIEPLGLTSTGFSVGEVPAANVVEGHFKLGEDWAVEPFAEPGEFSPLGGLFSSVRDLAVWAGGFADAFPARGEPDDAHPLSRASRREMQQLQRFNDVTVPATHPGLDVPAIRARVSGYGLGLVATHDTRWGQIVGHSGGYPGYGSHMRWHVASGVGVIALGNGRYMPASEPASAALEVVLASLDAPSRRLTRWARTRELQRVVHQLVIEWDDTVADTIFASNVDADLGRDARRAAVGEVSAKLGAIASVDGAKAVSANAAEIDWWIVGEHGRAKVELLLTPQAVPLVQEMEITFVADPTARLEAAAVEAARALPGADEKVHVECVECADESSATFRVRLGVDEWKIKVVADAETGVVSATTVTATPPSARRFDVSADPENS